MCRRYFLDPGPRELGYYVLLIVDTLHAEAVVAKKLLAKALDIGEERDVLRVHLFPQPLHL